jgi:glucan biosynthesis protein
MIRTIALAAGVAILSLPALAATTQADAQAALAAAQAVENDALAAKAAWTTTEANLTKSAKALAAGKWDEAKAAADEALALAKLSIEQANAQKTIWRNAVVR